MPQLSLSLATLGAINGGAARSIIDRAIEDVLNDLDDRGDDQKPRQVIIALTVKKLENGLVETFVEAHVRAPKRRTFSTMAKIRKTGAHAGLVFQEASDADPDQDTFEFHEGKEGE